VAEYPIVFSNCILSNTLSADQASGERTEIWSIHKGEKVTAVKDKILSTANLHF
jgi:hypothetical protein